MRASTRRQPVATGRSGRKTCAFLLAWVLIAVPLSGARAQLPPAGSVISSASLACYDTGAGRGCTGSNTIHLSVAPVYRPLVAPDGDPAAPAAIAAAYGGETVLFPFTLTNAGNAPDTFILSADVVAPSDFQPPAAVYLDADGDGTIDPGAEPITRVGPAGQGVTVRLLLAALVPAGLAGGERAHLDLAARSAADTSRLDRGNVVRIVARTDTRIAASLSASAAEVAPGAEAAFTIHFENIGERGAADLVAGAWIDREGLLEGTEFVPGTAAATIPGTIEYFDADLSQWVGTLPAPERIKGVRLRGGELAPGAAGEFSFSVRVARDREWGEIRSIFTIDCTGGDGQPRRFVSNEVAVRVARAGLVRLGPHGHPDAPAGGAEDRVVAVAGAADTMCVFSYEVRNDGNFADTLHIALADSSLIPAGWEVAFIDSAGAPLEGRSSFSARLGAVERGGSRRVALRLAAAEGGLRGFSGRELVFESEAYSLLEPAARDRVQNVLLKADVAPISVKQSIRETSAMIGDILSFIVSVENLTDETRIDSLVLVEHLPPGLGYAGGDGAPSIDGNRVRWELGSLGPGERRRIVLRARVTAGQERGELVASARVAGVTGWGERVAAGPARASVRIVEGEFTRRGIVFGSVFIDEDGDGVRGPGERGVFGARIYCQTGTCAVTDSSGLWSLPGLEEGRHVLRIDPKSLPDSLSPGAAGHFGLRAPGRFLIDLAPSGNRRVDFPLQRREAPVEEDVFAAIEDSAAAVARGGAQGKHRAPGEDAAGSGMTWEAVTLSGALFRAGSAVMEEMPLHVAVALNLWLRENPGWTLSIEGHADSLPIRTAEHPSNFELSLARAQSIFRFLLANGIPAERMEYAGFGSAVPVADNLSEAGRARNRRVEIRAVPPADSAGVCADIVRPAEGRIYTDRDGIEVEVLAPLGAEVELYVNSAPVGREKIGRRSIDTGAGTVEYIFYGVKIAPGPNTILVVCRTGGEHIVCTRSVYLAGKPARIEAERGALEVPADGAARPEIVFLVSDAAGLPVRDGLFVTVTGPPDLIAAADVNPHVSGVQVATTGGRAVVPLAASADPRRATIGVSLGALKAECRLEYISPMRDWFLLGYAEGDVGYGRLTGGGSTRHTYARHHDGAYAEGRLSLFGQGEVRSGHLMTLAVDTRPIALDKLLDRIEPEKHYPLYGDASDLRFNSSSRSGTYLALGHRRYSALLGDYRTELGGLEFTSYNRTLNGLRAEGRAGRLRAVTFLAATDQSTFQEEIPGAGTSGFYFLSRYPLLENSEKIRIEVRDRYRPERIVRVDDKNWGRDYDINYLDGSILFKEPVPAYDDAFNPVTIVVSYECRVAGERNLIYGARPTVALSDSLVLGLTAAIEGRGAGTSSLVGVDLAGWLRRDLRIESEYARSDRLALGDGAAFRLRLGGGQGGPLAWNAYYRNIDETFFNPSFSGGKTELGSTKIGGDLGWRIAGGWSIRAQGYSHAFAERDERKRYADLLGGYRSGAASARAGLAAAAHGDSRAGDRSALLLRAGAGLERRGAQVDIEVDRVAAGDEVQEYPDRIQANLRRRIWRGIDGRLAHEYRSGRDTGSRHLTQLGLESSLSEDLHMFSRYRREGALSGERGQASLGLKNRFRLSPGLTANFSVENLATVSGDAQGDFTSVATDWVFTPPGRDYLLKGGYEIRLEPGRRTHLSGLGGLKRLGPHWAGLLKADAWYADEKTRRDQVKGSASAGLSVRPAAGRLTLFSLLKGRYERNSPAHPEAVDKALTVMSEANYMLGDRWQIEGKAAARWVKNTFASYTTGSASFMYQAQLVRAVGKSWDIGLAARVVDQRETGTLRCGGGIEAGKVVTRGLRVCAGYDFGAHRGGGEANEFTSSGFRVGIRMLFDERLLEYFHTGE